MVFLMVQVLEEDQLQFYVQLIQVQHLPQLEVFQVAETVAMEQQES